MPSLVATQNVSMWRRVDILKKKSGIYRLKVSGEIFVVITFFVVRIPSDFDELNETRVVLCSPLLVSASHNLK
jgi:hypothetical protein